MRPNDLQMLVTPREPDISREGLAPLIAYHQRSVVEVNDPDDMTARTLIALRDELDKAEENNANLRAMAARVKAAVDFVEPMDRASFDKVIADCVLKNGLSLRDTAKKHATTVGRVRGALSRLQDAARLKQGD